MSLLRSQESLKLRSRRDEKTVQRGKIWYVQTRPLLRWPIAIVLQNRECSAMLVRFKLLSEITESRLRDHKILGDE